MNIYKGAVLVFYLISGLITANSQTADTWTPGKIYLPVILESIELSVRDADGIALGDITGNGKIDILASEGSHG